MNDYRGYNNRFQDLFCEPPAVPFIKNRLPLLHPAFANLPVHYDSSSAQYRPNLPPPMQTKTQTEKAAYKDSHLAAPSPKTFQTLTQTLTQQLQQTGSGSSTAFQHVPPTTTLPTSNINNSIQNAGKQEITIILDDSSLSTFEPRTEWTEISAMKYWNITFDEALEKFKTTVPEPKKKPEPKYSIRDKTSWDGVYGALEFAREKYLDDGGKGGWLRSKRRLVADRIAPQVLNASINAGKLAGNDPQASPVIAAVEILLDAVTTSAGVRAQALAGFDGLVAIFADVELFLGTFPRDSNIRNSSVELTKMTLIAIEQTVAFFLSSSLYRSGKALLNGQNYEKTLISSLEAIHASSKSLMEQAIKSHIHGSHMYSQETQKLLGKLFNEQRGICSYLNSVESLLSEHLERQDKLLEAAQQQITQLHEQNSYLRSASPMLINVYTPPPPVEQPTIGWYMTQDSLRTLLNATDLDLIDLDFIATHKEMLPERQRGRAEQIVSSELFQQWLVSTQPSKLLIHWDNQPPRSISGVSPLSTFVASLGQAVRQKQRFMSLHWFCGRHADADVAGPYIGGCAMLVSLVDQLLRQYAFDTYQLHNFINISSLTSGNINELMRLFLFLMGQLPQTMTILCFIDGAYLYERDEFCNEAVPIMRYLVGLASPQSRPMAATFKVMLTSTPGTNDLRCDFEDEELILNVDNLARLSWAPSDERMEREILGE